MTHIFITRLAVHITGKASRLNTTLKNYDSIDDRIHDIIQYWLVHGSQFYTQQSIDSPFKVYLIYSSRYTHILKAYDFPEWVHLIRDRNIDRVSDVNMFSEYDGEGLSITRVDADDWYSNDYFEVLERDYPLDYPEKDLSVILNKDIIQFNRLDNTVSHPVRYSSPGFGSLIFKTFSKSKMPINMRLWPHGNIKRFNHTEPLDINCIQSVGINAANKWRMCAKINPTPPVDRFYIPTCRTI